MMPSWIFLAVFGSILAAAAAEVPATTGLRSRNNANKKDARRTNRYWAAPIRNVGLTCIDNSIRAGGGKPTEICMTEGEALCVQYDFKPMGGRWQFGIKDSRLRLYNPKGQGVWEYCTDVSHVCIGEDHELVPDRHSKERPYLTFYNEKTHTVVGLRAMGPMERYDDKNIGQSTMLKLTDQADVGPYADYPLTIIKFKKGQTENPDHDHSLWNITVRKSLPSEPTGLDLESFLNYNADKCEWNHYPYVDSFQELRRQIAGATDPANRAKIGICDDSPIVFESVIDLSNKYFEISCLGSDCVFDLNGYSFVSISNARLNRGLYAEFESITIENGSADKGRGGYYTPGYGGAFLLRGVSLERFNLATLVLKKCIVRDNAARRDSGVVEALYSTVIATDTIFTDNKAMGSGGVMFSFGVNWTFKSCRFERNSARWGGGGAFAFYASMDATSFENCDFQENIAAGSGGAISFQSTLRSRSIKNCRFKKNSAGISGGAILLAFGSLSLEDSQFIGNIANDDGGAIYFGQEVCPSCRVSSVMDNCFFAENSAGNDGGAIFVFRIAATSMTDCHFEANTAASSGGAAYVRPDGSLAAVDCKFTENIVTEGGGALASFGASTLQDCQFEGNSAPFAGAIYSNPRGNPAGTIISGAKTLFKCNVASSSSQSGVGGGAVLHWQGKLSISDAKIVANSAASFGGGVLFGENSIASLNNCRLEQNVVVGESDPAGDNPASVSILTVNNTVFEGNTINVAGLSSKDIYGNLPSTTTFECGEGFGNCFCDANPSVDPNITTNDLPTTCSGAGVGQTCSGCTSSIVHVICPEPRVATSTSNNNRMSVRTGVATPVEDFMDMWDMLEKLRDEEGADHGDYMYVEAIRAQDEEKLKHMNVTMPGELTEAPTKAPSTAA